MLYIQGPIATDLEILLKIAASDWTGPYRISNHEEDLRWYENLGAVVPSSTQEDPSM
jgi:hypothetical protein